MSHMRTSTIAALSLLLSAFVACTTTTPSQGIDAGTDVPDDAEVVLPDGSGGSDAQSAIDATPDASPDAIADASTSTDASDGGPIVYIPDAGNCTAINVSYPAGGMSAGCKAEEAGNPAKRVLDCGASSCTCLANGVSGTTFLRNQVNPDPCSTVDTMIYVAGKYCGVCKTQ